MNTELRKVVAQPELQRQLAEQGYEPLSGTAESFDAYIRSEIAQWTRVVKAARINVSN